MDNIFIFYIVTLLYGFLFGSSAAVDCGPDWTPYKDEACVKLFLNQLDTWEDAAAFCTSAATSNLEPSLPIIMEVDYQEFILNELILKEDLYDNIWLGLKFDEANDGFHWIGGRGMVYQNWAPGFPREMNDTDRCVEIRPPNNILQSPSFWYDVPCRKRNLVVCQKKPSWTIDEISKELVELRKQIIPVGFIYTQPPFGQAPGDIWPALKWADISSEANGLFFRTTGEAAGEWGEVQEDCAPRIYWVETASGDWPTNGGAIPKNGWSVWFRTGQYGSHSNGYIPYRTRFQSADCEVRPKNLAVKLWKRVE